MSWTQGKPHCKSPNVGAKTSKKVRLEKSTAEKNLWRSALQKSPNFSAGPPQNYHAPNNILPAHHRYGKLLRSGDGTRVLAGAKEEDCAAPAAALGGVVQRRPAMHVPRAHRCASRQERRAAAGVTPLCGGAVQRRPAVLVRHLRVRPRRNQRGDHSRAAVLPRPAVRCAHPTRLPKGGTRTERLLASLAAAGLPELFTRLSRGDDPPRVVYVTGHWMDVDDAFDLARAGDFL